MAKKKIIPRPVPRIDLKVHKIILGLRALGLTHKQISAKTGITPSTCSRYAGLPLGKKPKQSEKARARKKKDV